MIFAFWDIPGIQSNKSLEVLERSLSPICIYDPHGSVIYTSQSFLRLLQTTAEKIGYFDYFPSNLTPSTTLKQFWNRALQGETVGFLAKTKDVGVDFECSLQFNPDANLMFLTAKKTDSPLDVHPLVEAYERSIAMFDHVNLATALISQDGAVIKCNQRLHELLGTSDREALSLEKFVHPEDKQIDAELRHKLLNGEIESYTIEKRLISRNQDVIWLNASFSLIEMAVPINGCRKYLVAVLEDITESRKIYSALVRTEEKWKAFVLNSPYLFIHTSNTGQIIYVSPAVEHLLGYREEELLGRQVAEFIHISNTNEFQLAFEFWLKEIPLSSTGIECWWKTKSDKWIAMYIQGQRFPSDLEIDGIVISGYNITDRKCLEVELRSSRERFQALVFNLPGAVFCCDSTYTMEYMSDGIEAITGYPGATFINNEMQSYLSIVHPDDISQLKDSLIQSIMDHHRVLVEYRIIHADGSIRWVSESRQGIFDHSGNLLKLEGVLLDISERVQLATAHKQAETEQRKLRMQLYQCQAINQAIFQMLPGELHSDYLEFSLNLLLSQDARLSE
jgi:PAS domain S-box-containing protein